MGCDGRQQRTVSYISTVTNVNTVVKSLDRVMSAALAAASGERWSLPFAFGRADLQEASADTTRIAIFSIVLLNYLLIP